MIRCSPSISGSAKDPQPDEIRLHRDDQGPWRWEPPRRHASLDSATRDEQLDFHQDRFQEAPMHIAINFNKNRTKGWQSLLLTMFVSLAQLLIDDSLAFSPNQDEFTEQVEATKFADIHLDGARIRKTWQPPVAQPAGFQAPRSVATANRCPTAARNASRRTGTPTRWSARASRTPDSAPNEHARLAILFPHARPQPERVWISGKSDDDTKEDLKRLIGVEELGRRETYYNPILWADLSEDGDDLSYEAARKVQKRLIFTSDNKYIFKYQAGKEHPEYNLSTMHCCASGVKNRLEHGWSGPAVAYAPGADMDPVAYSDVVAWLIWYGWRTRGLRPSCGPKVEAVKIACPGEQQLVGSPSHASVQLPRMHPLFDSLDGKVSDISKAIGMPLITWKQPQTKAQATAWQDVPNGRFSQVAYMHKGIDPTQQAGDPTGFLCSPDGGYGLPPVDWDAGLGTVYIARLDREPLDPELVQAFGDFCQFHMSAFFQLARERRLNNESSEARTREIEDLAGGKDYAGSAL
ncbi:hypothetical protein CLAFUW4_02496 [Fulvia fulva]|uniref:Uncharacterized protein n=1 Tax=Passalora fulva TaxID=5499 RepID=A0A9Q8LBZ2_PASFU|nr:uncharacterized protein CLAFUR5_02486 [Fulvia fulva]KAK4632381.1 hypothetical protein CLAFUR4_02491 [Fulvia fulva]KAK4632938.1 hypothetical protein CLAFUR0_02495 [Fulvia fulva]UJO14607.1 hypothetical protein CLAFUR5_02486 [Fulvia fulva]WPV10445.1 hypothetical protein CLAFUW4_02496 [Fulvia fulva]WPV25828.1 hypothetical protein CLAFUW7_02496 [Fulvia fulva]